MQNTETQQGYTSSLGWTELGAYGGASLCLVLDAGNPQLILSAALFVLAGRIFRRVRRSS
jgi:hypothetical protein